MATPSAPSALPTPAVRARTSPMWLRRSGRWATPVIATILFIAIVQAVVAVGIISSESIPLPTVIIRAFVDALGTTSFWSAVGLTLEGWAIGMGIATVAGIPLGILAGTSTAAFRSMRFVVDFLRPIPSVAILPLAILVLGIAMPVKISLAALAAFFPIFFATLYGIQDLDPVTNDTAKAYKLNAMFRFVFVVLPGSTPYIATGMRISASVALLLTVGTEMIVGLPGIGLSIYKAQYANDLPSMYALIAASGILGVVISICFKAVERRALKWHPSQLREIA